MATLSPSTESTTMQTHFSKCRISLRQPVQPPQASCVLFRVIQPSSNHIQGVFAFLLFWSVVSWLICFSFSSSCLARIQRQLSQNRKVVALPQLWLSHLCSSRRIVFPSSEWTSPAKLSHLTQHLARPSTRYLQSFQTNSSLWRHSNVYGIGL
jgi:hypothetical protein